MSNIHGLFSGRRDDDDDDQNDNDNRYVGGVSSQGGGSGLAVQPNMDENNGAPNAGDDSIPPPVDAVFGMASEATSEEERRPRRTITMYRDGFVVDEDGPYRRLDDPANAEFLRSLARGQTPRELLMEDQEGGAGPGSDMTVGLIDKRNEEYVPTFKSFRGTGNTLGGTTTTATTSTETSDNGIIAPSTLQDVKPPAVTNDPQQPTTSIQIRLISGQRRVIKINTNATVLQLASHLADSVQPFRLISGYPPKPITDLSQTIQEAGLKGAQVVQKGV
mmetsp:Transcript_21355/g.30706  ORF Transcript_21355/g.30706 Transcript_21355/m.30706 type:complete len:276 (-) Transcript_21355:136-963(-)|eukprot:CAMPEP_0202455742 /NCGR_PEP_ID=MMETSP1360-20130828/13196_1 /ASSEMBLY_ACC=CAM_ASM_000848 /TAXON_ID=515479 /ORGANISM="Licmophora paradoxa, Strain CCMP2313" /LENGTH=275 /DNA_ID=CAMNT_0049075389 /DNA_START=134 /DNA_END=961 /DNA_ORIENTATION=+